MIVWRGPVQFTARIVDRVPHRRLRFYGIAFGRFALGLLVNVKALEHELTNGELRARSSFRRNLEER